MSQTPRFTHTCKRCVFIPTATDPRDWYVCHSVLDPAVIARSGEEGDFWSMPYGMCERERSPSEVWSVTRAIAHDIINEGFKAGLIKRESHYA